MTPQANPKSSNQSPQRNNHLLASVAHLSILTVILIGPFSMAVPLLIWLLERNKADKSSFIEFQAKQAFFFQAAAFVIAAVLGICMGILSIILIGLLLIPVLILFGLAVIVYGVYGGIQVYRGNDFRYIYLADFIEAGSK
jgi:uncharacterized Tic20 family protein